MAPTSDSMPTNSAENQVTAIQQQLASAQADNNALRANIERMHAENPQGSAVIQADTASENGMLVKVLDAARLAGITNVSIAAEVVE